MKKKTVLISGASIAGPALAFWLQRQGYEPTVVERAPSLRQGGQAVDFRGPAHMHVLARMGMLEAIRAAQTRMREVTIVDEASRTLVRLPARFMSGDVEILRGDLSRILYDATRGGTEYMFDDAIRSLTETSGGVDVEFQRAAPRSFDLVVGADGLHSGVRALVWGDEAPLLRFHGYYVAGFSAPNRLKLENEGRIFGVPGKSVSVTSAQRPAEATVLFVFSAPPRTYERRDLAAQKSIVARAFAKVGWETPRLLTDLEAASDAAYGGTLGGQGTGLAMVGAYVLAGELAAAEGDHRVAFARYQGRMERYARACQAGAKRVGAFYAPPTRARMWLRNQTYRALTSRPLAGVLDKLVAAAASSITLDDYPRLGDPARLCHSI